MRGIKPWAPAFNPLSYFSSLSTLLKANVCHSNLTPGSLVYLKIFGVYLKLFLNYYNYIAQCPGHLNTSIKEYHL